MDATLAPDGSYRVFLCPEVSRSGIALIRDGIGVSWLLEARPQVIGVAFDGIG